MPTRVILTALAASLIAPAVRGDIITRYDFGPTSSPTEVATTVDPDVAATDFRLFRSGARQSLAFSLGGDSPSGGAYASNDGFDEATTFYSFEVSPTAGNVLSLDDLNFEARTGGNNNETLEAAFSVDGGSTFASLGTEDFSVWETVAFDLSGVAALQNVAAPVEFRLFAALPFGTPLRTFRVDAVTLEGAATPAAVPEPATSLLLMGAVAGGVLLRRRVLPRGTTSVRRPLQL